MPKSTLILLIKVPDFRYICNIKKNQSLVSFLSDAIWRENALGEIHGLRTPAKWRTKLVASSGGDRTALIGARVLALSQSRRSTCSSCDGSNQALVCTRYICLLRQFIRVFAVRCVAWWCSGLYALNFSRADRAAIFVYRIQICHAEDRRGRGPRRGSARDRKTSRN